MTLAAICLIISVTDGNASVRTIYIILKCDDAFIN